MKKRKEKRKQRNKDSLYFRIKALIQKDRFMIQRSTKIFRIRTLWKISHTCTSWSKCVTCISLRSGFWLSKICDASMPHFHNYLKLHSKPLVVGYEKKAKSNAFGEVSYTLSDRENHLRNLHLFCKTYKTLDRWSIKERMIGSSVITILPKNFEKLYAPQGSR